MARYDFKLPDIGEGIAEAEIVAWHVKPGDVIEEDARLADIMTDKATVEMESPVSGTVLALGGEEGEVIAIGSVLVVIDTGEGGADADIGSFAGIGESAAAGSQVHNPVDKPGGSLGGAVDNFASGSQSVPNSSPQNATSEERPDAAAPAVDSPVDNLADKAAKAGISGGGSSERYAASNVASESTQSAPQAHQRAESSKVMASPAVRARAHALGIDLAAVKPSGADVDSSSARIRHADLDQFIAYNRAGGFAPASPQTRGDSEIKVIGMRRKIAENMAASKRNIPHFTYVEECDVTALEAMRAELNSVADGDSRPRLTILPLFIAGVCKAVPAWPMINALYDDSAGVVTRKGAVHMGIAVQTDAGLMVPVIKNAQALNLWQIAREILRLSQAARSGSITKDEMSGGTLTVTSLGPLGGIASTPVINPPQVAIIGPNRIIERPMFISDGLGGERIAKRKLMNISISCDHRVVDGWDAASFVQTLKGLLEKPSLIFAD